MAQHYHSQQTMADDALKVFGTSEQAELMRLFYKDLLKGGKKTQQFLDAKGKGGAIDYSNNKEPTWQQRIGQRTTEDITGQKLPPATRSPSGEARAKRLIADSIKQARRGDPGSLQQELHSTKPSSVKTGIEYLGQLSKLPGTGSSNILGAAEVAGLGFGGVSVTSMFTNEPTSLARYYLEKGAAMSSAQRIAQKRVGDLEITVWADRNTANLARLLGAKYRPQNTRRLNRFRGRKGVRRHP